MCNRHEAGGLNIEIDIITVIYILVWSSAHAVFIVVPWTTGVKVYLRIIALALLLKKCASPRLGKVYIW